MLYEICNASKHKKFRYGFENIHAFQYVMEMLYVCKFCGRTMITRLHPQTLKLEWTENTSQADQTGTFQCYVYGLVLCSDFCQGTSRPHSRQTGY